MLECIVIAIAVYYFSVAIMLAWAFQRTNNTAIEKIVASLGWGWVLPLLICRASGRFYP